MRLLFPAALAIVPLALAPGILVYFDVTPKLALLFICCAMGLVVCRAGTDLSKRGRLFLLLLAAQLLSLVVSTAFSTDAALSFGGSNWRRLGLASETAVLVFAALVFYECRTHPSRLVLLLKGIVAGAIPVAFYGILQYCGVDPILPKQFYHAGEDTWAIVRPPSTLGHASYLATFLLFATFASAALLRLEKSRIWRILSYACIGLGCAGILFSGTRAALLGLGCGALLLARRPEIRKPLLAFTGATVFALVMLFLTPLGTGLRHRITWVAGEPLGGVRPALWRDALVMSASRLLTGFGPEVFVEEFPRFESTDLARQSPEFLHESPHNIFLDALVSQGIPGALLLVALCAFAFRMAWRSRSEAALPLAAGLLAAVVAQQFTCFTLVTNILFYVFVALIVALDEIPAPEAQRVRFLRIPAWGLAGGFGVLAAMLLIWDGSMAAASHALDHGDLRGSARHYARAAEWGLRGWSADIFYSRRLAAFASASTDFRTKVEAWRMAEQVAARATATSEEKQNAWFNLAAMLSPRNDPASVERCLRRSIAAAPNWYKPHWALAKVLLLENRPGESRSEADTAIACNGRRPELLRTLDVIRAAQVR